MAYHPPAAAQGAAALTNMTGGVDLACHSEIQLFLSAKGLRKADLLSESDPFAVVYLLEGQGNWREIGR